MRFAHHIELGTLAAAPLLATALLGAPAALAAAPWSAPQTIGVSAGQPPGIALPIPGEAAASAQQLLALPGGGIALAADTNLYLVQHPGATPTFVAPEGFTGEISPDGVLGPLAAIGGGRGVSGLLAAGASRIRALGTTGDDQTLSSAWGRPGQTLRASTTLEIPGGSVVATTSNAILVRRCSRDCVRSDLAIVRRQEHVWTAPRRITFAGTEVRGGAITTLPHGVIAVAFERRVAGGSLAPRRSQIPA